MKGTLHLLPITLGAEDPLYSIPQGVLERTKQIKVFACENIKTTRRYLKRLDRSIDIDERTFILFNKKSGTSEVHQIMQYLLKGEDVGVISEAGCPAVADPGNLIVAQAHQEGLTVKPYVGPNSILMTLMASGFNGQNFAFVGYAPIDKTEKVKWINNLWRKVNDEGQTQLFMETPYRNNQMMEAILSSLPDMAYVAIGANLTTDEEKTTTKTIKEWKQQKFNFHKIPLIFALGMR